ncbi:MAG: glycosyltransferase family 2 protein [Myxococcaceae bacterium]
MDRAGACVCIPVFNNVKTVGSVVRGALAHASTVLVGDDGSTDGSGDAAKQAGATVLTLPRNQGKGAALEMLFAEATRRGFRYALCLDADGQHLHEDLPKLAAATLASPGALILGARDLVAAGAPGSSQFGRKFSNFWVWLESGSRVEDSQSGFRAYPLPEASRLHVKRRRYDYEVEILLKAAWAGVPIVSVPIGVIYPKDRVTHFRPFLDNTRISLLNLLTCIRLFLPLPLVDERFYETPNRPGLSLYAIRRWLWIGGHGPWHKLVCAALAVLAAVKGWWWLLPLTAVTGVGLFPGLAFYALALRFGWLVWGAGLAYGLLEKQLIRRVEPMPTWSGKRRGGVLGHLIFYWLIRYVGAAPAYLLLYPVALYFVFAAKPAREASREFLDRVLGPAQGFERHRRAFRHFHAFSRTLLDGFVLGAKGNTAFSRHSQGREHFQNAISAGKGAVLVTAHIGNYQVSSSMLESNVDTQLALVVFQGEEEQLKKVLERGTGHKPRIIAVGRDELSSLEILRALREGWLVAMQGDRAIDNQVVRVPFLGREAAFPVGPFAIAALSGAPLISTFGIQTAPRTYEFVADAPVSLRFERGVDRTAQLRAWVEAYVKRLEAIVRAHPYQWFNFYDFWAPPKA